LISSRSKKKICAGHFRFEDVAVGQRSGGPARAGLSGSGARGPATAAAGVSRATAGGFASVEFEARHVNILQKAII